MAIRRLLIGVALASLLCAQQNGPAGNNSGQTQSGPPIGVPALYRAFFRHLAFLDQQADALDAQGKDGSALRNFYQNAIGLTVEEAAVLKQAGGACVTAVQQTDQAAQQLIQAARAKFPDRKVPSAAALPKPPAELGLLNKQRDDVSNLWIANLRASLGPASFQKLDTYVQTRFVRQVSSVAVPNPPAAPPFSQTPASSGGAH